MNYQGFEGWIPNPEAAKAFVATLPWQSLTEAIGGVTAEDGNSFLWRALAAAMKVERIHSRNQGQIGSCFPAGTLVRMEDGSEKRIEEIRTTDRVVTAERNCGTVLQTMVRRHCGELCRLLLWGSNALTATPEHPILTRRGYVAISELTPDDWVAMPRYAPEASTCVQTAQFITTRYRVKHRRERVFSAIPGKALSRGMIYPVPDVIALTPGFGRLIGLFLAEGSTDYGKMRWTFSLDEEHTLVAEAVALLKSELDLDARVQYRRANKSINVTIDGVEWAQLFEGLCSTGAGAKSLCPELSMGPLAFLEQVLSGWLAGDGHERRGGVDGVTISHSLAMSMFDIAQAVGMRPTMRWSLPSANEHAATRQTRWDVEIHSKGDNYRVEQTDTHVWRRVREVSRSPFSGLVFNLHVEGDESYVAEGVGCHNCVGHGTATGIDITAACEIMLKGEPEKWVAQASSAAMYGAGRQIANQLGNWEGSNGSWAAEAVTKYGTLYMLEYPGHDLRTYSESLAREFQRRGLDESLKAEAAKHKMGLAAPVRNGEEAWTALMNGYGVNVCSDVGFQGNRNEKGAIARRGSWGHSMAWIGCLTIDGERYFTVQQSWGDNWCSGPYYPADAPLGSFNISFRDGDAMCRQGDSYAYSGLAGFQRRRSVFDALLGNPLTDVNGKTSVFDSLL